MPRKETIRSGTWKGRGCVPNGKVVIITAEADDDPEKTVSVYVPLSKVDQLVNSLYRARTDASRLLAEEQARTVSPERLPEYESAFFQWLAERHSEYAQETAK